MYIKNKLGIYVYQHNVYYIYNKHWSVNSIAHTRNIKYLSYRVINHKTFGIEIRKFNKYVHKK